MAQVPAPLESSRIAENLKRKSGLEVGESFQTLDKISQWVQRKCSLMKKNVRSCEIFAVAKKIKIVANLGRMVFEDPNPETHIP